MPDYYSQYCVCGPEEIILGMRDLEGNETTSYPVDVYNVNEELIGIATTKAEYITVWNSDPANQAVGVLGNGVGPFSFTLVLNDGQDAPDWVIGVSHTAGRPVGIYELQYEDQYE
jgi:hypothetical protein